MSKKLKLALNIIIHTLFGFWIKKHIHHKTIRVQKSLSRTWSQHSKRKLPIPLHMKEANH
ncbi:hypothetical protein HanPI659440_Chr00c05g0713501 [Helianthus annuus]|nr:hypothetical protein HanPI659440_Chr00c05g0713501 [Helianthus annuus]